MSTVEERTANAVAAVEKWGEENTIYPGDLYYSKPRYANCRELHRLACSRGLSDDFASADLQRAAKRGLVYMHEYVRELYRWSGGVRKTRTERSYTTLQRQAEGDAEAALSPLERAERFMAYFVPYYEQKRTEYGDNPHLWPRRPYQFEGDIKHALDAGLVVPVDRRSFGSGAEYVPASHFDAYQEALDNYDTREARAQLHHDKIVENLSDLIDSEVRSCGRTIELTTRQAEEIVNHIMNLTEITSNIEAEFAT